MAKLNPGPGNARGPRGAIAPGEPLPEEPQTPKKKRVKKAVKRDQDQDGQQKND